MEELIFIPQKRRENRLDDSEVFSKVQELRQRHNLKVTQDTLSKGTILIMGDHFKLMISHYGKVQVISENAISRLTAIKVLEFVLEEPVGPLIYPGYVRGAKCWEDITWMVKGRCITVDAASTSTEKKASHGCAHASVAHQKKASGCS